MKFKNKYRSNKGFTLAEVLIVVAISLVLATIGFVSVITYQKKLKFKEMNDTARSIFIAVQNQITADQAKGEDDLFKDWTKCSKVECKCKELVYFEHDGKGHEVPSVLPLGAIDETVRVDGHYIIEVCKDTGFVHGVFYTDSKAGISGEYDFLNKHRNLNDSKIRKDLINHTKDNEQCIIGYYGGDTMDQAQGVSIDPQLTIYNDESLRIKVELPKDSLYKIDSINVEAKLPKESNSEYVSMKNGSFIREETDDKGKTYYVAYLDSITMKDGHFGQLFDEHLVGKDVDVRITVKGINKNNSSEHTLPAQKVVRVNSSFASIDHTKDLASKDKISITNARHLQNLSHEISSVDLSTFTNPVIVEVGNDISWKEFVEKAPVIDGNNIKTGNANVFAYSGAEYQGNKFVSIQMNQSMVLNGNQFKLIDFNLVSNDTNVGLFGKVTNNLVINELFLENPVIEQSADATNAGSFVGLFEPSTNDKELKISKCGVFDKDKEQYRDHIDPKLKLRQLNGQYVGGLVGSNEGNLRIEDSFASISCFGEHVVGGLVGQSIKSASTTIERSYTGGFIEKDQENKDDEVKYSEGQSNIYSASIAGGIIGNVAKGSKIELNNVYSTASVQGKIAAGLVGKISGNGSFIKESYAANQVFGVDTDSTCSYFMNVADGVNVTLSKNEYISYSSDYDIQSNEGTGIKQVTSDEMIEANIKNRDKQLLEPYHVHKLYEGKYPYKAVTNTGFNLIENATKNNNTHFGDWCKLVDDGASYGLVYYEIGNDKSISFNGYMNVDGKYLEIKSSLPFEKEVGKTLKDEGYLLLVNDANHLLNKTKLKLTTVNDKNVNVEKPINLLFDEESSVVSNKVVEQLQALYPSEKSVSKLVKTTVKAYKFKDGTDDLFGASNCFAANNGGTVLQVLKNKKVDTEFEFLPFFANTVTKKEDIVEWQTRQAFEIRSARQFNECAKYNKKLYEADTNSSWLNRDNRTVVISLDINFNGIETSPITNLGCCLSSEKDGERYTVNQTDNFLAVSTLWYGKISNLNLKTNKLPNNKEALVLINNGTIENVDVNLDGGGAEYGICQNNYGNINFCKIHDAKKLGYGICKLNFKEISSCEVRDITSINCGSLLTNIGKIKDCTVQSIDSVNAQGFVSQNEGSIVNCHVSQVNSIDGNGFAFLNTTMGKVGQDIGFIKGCSVSAVTNINGNGFINENASNASIDQCNVTDVKTIRSNGFMRLNNFDGNVSGCSVIRAENVMNNGFANQNYGSIVMSTVSDSTTIGNNGFIYENTSNASIDQCNVTNVETIMENGFMSYNWSSVTNSKLNDVTNVHKNGFLLKNDSSAIVSDCKVEKVDSIDLSGFIETNDGTIEKCDVDKVKSITKTGFALQNVSSTALIDNCHVKNFGSIGTNAINPNDLYGKQDGHGFITYNKDGAKINECTVENGKLIKMTGFIHTNQRGDGQESVITNCSVNNIETIGLGDGSNKQYGYGFVLGNEGKIKGCKVSHVNEIYHNGFARNNGNDLNPDQSGLIETCYVTNVHVVSDKPATAFVDSNWNNGEISNCQVYGDDQSYKEYVTDCQADDSIEQYYKLDDPNNQYEFATVNSNKQAAGFVMGNRGTINKASFTGTVTSNGEYASGFVDTNFNDISESYSDAVVVSNRVANGFADLNIVDPRLKITRSLVQPSIINCYAVTALKGNTINGFIRGNVEPAVISDTYNAILDIQFNETGGQFSPFAQTPDSTGTFNSSYYFGDCYFLDPIKDMRPKPINGVEEKIYEKVMLPEKERKDADKYNVYNLLDEEVKYPFTVIDGLKHYGDWPEKPIVAGIVYYEDVKVNGEMKRYYHGVTNDSEKSKYGEVSTRFKYDDIRNKQPIVTKNGLIRNSGYEVINSGYIMLTNKKGSENSKVEWLNENNMWEVFKDSSTKNSEFRCYETVLDINSTNSMLSNKNPVNIKLNGKIVNYIPFFSDSVEEGEAHSNEYKLRSAQMFEAWVDAENNKNCGRVTFAEGKDNTVVIDYNIKLPNKNYGIQLLNELHGAIKANSYNNEPYVIDGIHISCYIPDITTLSASAKLINVIKPTGKLSGLKFTNFTSENGDGLFGENHGVIENCEVNLIKQTSGDFKPRCAFGSENFGQINNSSVYFQHEIRNEGFVWKNLTGGTISGCKVVARLDGPSRENLIQGQGFVFVNSGTIEDSVVDLTNGVITGGWTGTGNGFVDQNDGEIKRCDVILNNCQIAKDNGFVKNNTGTVEDSSVTINNSLVYFNGFAQQNDGSINGCRVSVSKSSIYGSGFVQVNNKFVDGCEVVIQPVGRSIVGHWVDWTLPRNKDWGAFVRDNNHVIKNSKVLENGMNDGYHSFFLNNWPFGKEGTLINCFMNDENISNESRSANMFFKSAEEIESKVNENEGPIDTSKSEDVVDGNIADTTVKQDEVDQVETDDSKNKVDQVETGESKNESEDVVSDKTTDVDETTDVEESQTSDKTTDIEESQTSNETDTSVEQTDEEVEKEPEEPIEGESEGDLDESSESSETTSDLDESTEMNDSNEEISDNQVEVPLDEVSEKGHE